MDVQLVRIVRVALSVLSDRLLTLIALAMTFILSGWVMNDPNWMREGMAAFFALFVFIPCILKERSKSHEGSGQQDEH
jgi:hypothetical protein